MNDDATPRSIVMRRRTLLQLGAVAGVGIVAESVIACTPTTATPQTGATLEPVKTDKITIIQDNAVDSLDPHVAQRNQAIVILGRINETLVERDPKTLQPRAKL